MPTSRFLVAFAAVTATVVAMATPPQASTAAPTPNSGPTAGGTDITVPVPGSGSFLAVASGLDHTLALDPGGNIWAWGDNRYGQLGNGQRVVPEQPRPSQVTIGREYVAIAAGNDVSLAIDSTGRLYAWGLNNASQLGIGSGGASEYLAPQAIIPAERFTQVSAGREFAIALDTGGRVWAWGSNADGRTGTGSADDTIKTPQPIASDQTFTHIAAGADHALAIDSDGDIWAWGQNAYGQVGVLDGGPTTLPRAVTDAITFVEVTAGERHSLALDSTGVLWAWGNDEFGQLGNGAEPSWSTPQPVAGAPRFASITAGAFHTLAHDAEGTVWGWGENTRGQLGAGTTGPTGGLPAPHPIALPAAAIAIGGGSVTYTSTAILDGGWAWAWGANTFGQAGVGSAPLTVVTPRAITPVNFSAVEAAFRHTVAIDEHGVLWTWGDNSFAQLGIGTASGRLPLPVPVTEQSRYTAISASARHTLALDEEGDIWSWGDNEFGQAGFIPPVTNPPDGGLKEGPAPVTANRPFVDVAAGLVHSLALDDEGRIWSWGFNADGQLGNGVAGPSIVRVPTMVATPDGTTFTAIDTMQSSNLALDSDGNLWSWGDGATGVLGNGPARDDVTAPQQITTDTRFTAISMGLLHALALDEEGGLWAWGDNFGGALGAGAGTPRRDLPHPVATDVSFTSIKASYAASLALDSSGRLWGWGRDDEQQLGNGADTNAIVRVPTLSHPTLQFTALGGRWSHAAGIGTDGRVYTWGSSEYGRLGNGRTGLSEFESSPYRLGGSSVITEISIGGASGTALERVSEKQARVTTPPGTAGLAVLRIAYTFNGAVRPLLELRSAFRYLAPPADPEPTPTTVPGPDSTPAPGPAPEPPTPSTPSSPSTPAPSSTPSTATSGVRPTDGSESASATPRSPADITEEHSRETDDGGPAVELTADDVQAMTSAGALWTVGLVTAALAFGLLVLIASRRLRRR